MLSQVFPELPDLSVQPLSLPFQPAEIDEGKQKIRDGKGKENIPEGMRMKRRAQAAQEHKAEYTGQRDKVQKDSCPERGKAVQKIAPGKNGYTNQTENSRPEQIKLGGIDSSSMDDLQKISAQNYYGKYHTENGEKIFFRDQPHDRDLLP